MLREADRPAIVHKRIDEFHSFKISSCKLQPWPDRAVLVVFGAYYHNVCRFVRFKPRIARQHLASCYRGGNRERYVAFALPRIAAPCDERASRQKSLPTPGHGHCVYVACVSS